MHVCLSLRIQENNKIFMTFKTYWVPSTDIIQIRAMGTQPTKLNDQNLIIDQIYLIMKGQRNQNMKCVAYIKWACDFEKSIPSPWFILTLIILCKFIFTCNYRYPRAKLLANKHISRKHITLEQYIWFSSEKWDNTNKKNSLFILHWQHVVWCIRVTHVRRTFYLKHWSKELWQSS